MRTIQLTFRLPCNIQEIQIFLKMFSNTESIIQHFPTLLYIILCQGTVDAVFLLTQHAMTFSSVTHMYYAKVLQNNSPCWTEHILTRANKFFPMNHSTNQRLCQVAEQIKDRSLGRLALRNRTRMIQRREQRLARLCYTVAIDTCLLTAPLWSCICSGATYEKLLRPNLKYLITK